MAIDRPENLHATTVQLFNAADLDGLLALYEETAKLVLPQGDVVGHDAIRQTYAGWFALNGKLHWETIAVIEGNGVALASGSWRFENQQGQSLLQGESAEVLRKSPEGHWLLAINCPFGPG